MLPANAVVVWLVEPGWPACVDAARRYAAPDDEIVLLHVIDEEMVEAAHGAHAGLLGRAHPDRDPGDRLAELGAAAACELLAEAAARLGRPCVRLQRTGRVEAEVVRAAERAGLLILSRDAPAVRFVVDGASCPVLLV